MGCAHVASRVEQHSVRAGSGTGDDVVGCQWIVRPRRLAAEPAEGFLAECLPSRLLVSVAAWWGRAGWAAWPMAGWCAALETGAQHLAPQLEPQSLTVTHIVEGAP